MEAEIEAASSHGVDFFQILWYPKGGQLNDGLRFFKSSTNAARMRFTIEYVNHPPFSLNSDTEWEEACKEWCAAMRHPSYLKLDGRPVFKIHGLDHLYTQLGNDPKRVEERLGKLKGMAQACGAGLPLLSCGVMPRGVPAGERIAFFDFTTTYMDMPSLPGKPELYEYDLLLAHAEEGWSRHAESSSKPHVPYVPAGWDPRPWNDPRPSFKLPDQRQWTRALRRVKAALDEEPNLRIKTGKNAVKMLLIYAWNEYGEGGIVAPTHGEKKMKLEAIWEVFGRKGLIRPNR